MKKFLLMITGLLFASFLYGQNPNLGTSGAQFLEIPVGAEAASLGGAFVGLSDDITSVFWNPAGISNIDSKAAHFSYMRYFDMFDFNAAAFAANFEGIGTFAVSVVVFTMDKMEITTETSPHGTGRFFDATDMAVGLTYAKELTDKFSVGVTAKFINQRIWNESASGVAFDVGTQYRLDFQNLTIAMRMSNFGPDLQFDGEDLNVTHDINSSIPLNRLTPARLVTDSYPLPLCFQVGIGVDVYSSTFMKVRAGLDAVHPNDNQERVNFGTEFSFFDRIFLRGGYKYNYDDEDFTFGAGVNLPFNGNVINFDYAYSLYDILPSIHRISLSLTF
ncbi:MAG: PorV/PorQ family protein [bacterium]